MENVDIQQIPLGELDAFLSWVHPGLSADQLSIIKDEYEQRESLVQAPPPLVARLGENRVAGVYFTCLPGRLAMLGSIRVVAGFSSIGVSLLQMLVDKLCTEFSVTQIQAAIPREEPSASEVLRAFGFQHLTDVDQMWLSLQPDGEIPGSLKWSPARSMTEDSFIDLIRATFEDTLDCPELNGLRSEEDVLESYLMGRSLDSIDLWEIAWWKETPVGCLLLTQHPRGVVEIAYMGLIRSARSHGFGRLLIHRAKKIAQDTGSTTLVLAVDCRNTPALKTYAKCGFQIHQRLHVYFLPAEIRSSTDHLMT